MVQILTLCGLDVNQHILWFSDVFHSDIFTILGDLSEWTVFIGPYGVPLCV